MKIGSMLLCVAVLSGCSTATVYERAAGELTTATWRPGGTGYVGSWFPLGDAHELSKNEEEKKIEVLSKCINELNASMSTDGLSPPNISTAAGQLIACMRDNGWQYTIDRVFVTS
jgi:hypothetical protein